MAVTPAFRTGATINKQRLWQAILTSMGYNDLNDLIQNITTSAGTPDTELSNMRNYSFVYDTTNKIGYFHTTDATFVAIGTAVTSTGGGLNNQNSQTA